MYGCENWPMKKENEEILIRVEGEENDSYNLRGDFS